MSNLSMKSKTEFLASMERLTTEAAAISHTEIATALESVPENDFTVAEWYKLTDFALDQIGKWQVKWLFSPAQTPDTVAQTEAEAWERLWDVFSKALVEQVPEVEVELHEKKRLSIPQQLMRQKVQQESGNRPAMFASSVTSRLAIVLNSLGCKSIAHRLYARALFPSGSVGRAQG